MNKINFVHVLHLYYIVREGYVGALNTYRLGGEGKNAFYKQVSGVQQGVNNRDGVSY